MTLTPLRPREFFARPWSGRGEFKAALPLRTRTFSFRSECEFLNDEEWLVHDTTCFDGGEPVMRTMRARLVSPSVIETEADDMPGGTEVMLESRGFRFRPYRLEVRVGLVKVRLRFHDRCWLDEDQVLHDEIKISWFRLPVGRIAMRLVPEA